jgi:ssDNA thymidine ADP-ribosyltransferase, DarT
VDSSLENRHVFHFTSGKNLPSIFEMARLICDAKAEPIVSVGNAKIKGARARRAVPCPPGGVVADYVPFYFAPRGPMFSKVVDKREPGWEQRQRALVYFVASVATLRVAEAQMLFTDRNASLAIAEFHAQPERLAIDWPLIDSRDWSWIPKQEEWIARHQAELLVHREVPLAAIIEIGVVDEDVADRVCEIAAGSGCKVPVTVERKWFL